MDFRTRLRIMSALYQPWHQHKWLRYFIICFSSSFVGLYSTDFIKKLERLKVQTCLLGADSACQLSMLDIRKARKWSTVPFHRVQPIFPSAGVATMNILWVFVNTDEILLVRVVVIVSHQVPVILLGPSRRTVISCGHHQQWTTWFDKADNTRRVVIIKTFFERVSIVLRNFILGSVHVCWVLIAIAVPVILGFVWKAKVVSSTTWMIVTFSTYYT